MQRILTLEKSLWTKQEAMNVNYLMSCRRNDETSFLDGLGEGNFPEAGESPPPYMPFKDTVPT
eukprot:4429503-Amphidinium_carterae.1